VPGQDVLLGPLAFTSEFGCLHGAGWATACVARNVPIGETLAFELALDLPSLSVCRRVHVSTTAMLQNTHSYATRVRIAHSDDER
jgi:hypothetical protein